MVKRLFNHRRKGTLFLRDALGQVKGLRFLKNYSSQNESSAHKAESAPQRVDAQKEAHERLQEVIATFEERTACMEPDFVELGQSLRSLYEAATGLAKKVNDRLAAFVKTKPDRFAAFGALATCNPAASANELERIVTRHGFKGAMIHGLTSGQFLDDKKFWPIFERAEKLDVPIYLHPSLPHPAVMDAYYKDYLKDFPMVIRAAWGFTVETATLAIRLVLSGAFDAHPRLKIVLGHLGETLPFLLWRIDQALSRPGGKTLSFREVFCEHFYITTSGNFSNPALLCCVMEMGIDRILFAVDYPFVANAPAVQWIDTIPLCDEDKIKLLSGNAKRLFRL